MLPDFFPQEDHHADTSNQISFHSEDTSFALVQPMLIKGWIHTIISKNNCSLESLEIIFCSDRFLHQLNVSYLNHDTLTDVITFPFSDPPKIEGEIYISIERVEENATIFASTFKEELHRVIIHGVLHLCGFKDKTDTEKKEMTAKENESLSLLR